MDTSVFKLRILDRIAEREELDLASELFHRINRVIPTNQKMLTIAPTQTVREAIELMQQHGYSQIPVVLNGEVLGLFSYRSFAKEAARVTLAELTQHKYAPGDLPVDEFLEQFEFFRVTEEMGRVLEAMNKDDGILVGSSERIIGIITPMDFLRYLYQVASPYVMVSEIELAIRALIRIALDENHIVIAARCCLAAAYGGEEKVPVTLENMTFENYKSLISHNKTWSNFEPIFGGMRNRVSAKLKEIGEIRNAIFHFRREITVRDHQTLADHRGWLLNKVKQAQTCCGQEVKS